MRGITNAIGGTLKSGQITYDNKNGDDGYVPASTFGNVSLSTDESFEGVYPKGFACSNFIQIPDFGMLASQGRSNLATTNGTTVLLCLIPTTLATYVYEISNNSLILKKSSGGYGKISLEGNGASCGFNNNFYLISSSNELCYIPKTYENWYKVSSLSGTVVGIAASDDIMIAVTTTGISSSSDGNSWVVRKIGSFSNSACSTSTDFNGNFIVYNPANKNVYYSKDGINWSNSLINYYGSDSYSTIHDSSGTYDSEGNLILTFSNVGYDTTDLVKVNTSNGSNQFLGYLGKDGQSSGYSCGAIVNFGNTDNEINVVSNSGACIHYSADTNKITGAMNNTITVLSSYKDIDFRYMSLAGACVDKINHKIYFGTYGNFYGVFIGDYGYVMPTFLEQVYVKK